MGIGKEKYVRRLAGIELTEEEVRELSRQESERKRSCLSCYYAKAEEDKGLECRYDCLYFKKENIPLPDCVMDEFCVWSHIDEDTDLLFVLGEHSGWTWEIENCATYRKQE